MWECLFFARGLPSWVHCSNLRMIYTIQIVLAISCMLLCKSWPFVYVLFCLWWSHHACWLCFQNITLVHNRILACTIRYLFITKIYFIIVDICHSNFCYFSRKTSWNVLNFHIMASTSSKRHCYCCTAWLQYIWHATSRFSLLLSSTPVVPFSQ